ncbi:MAG: pilus assembly protein PilM [Planctomycetota bacterium]
MSQTTSSSVLICGACQHSNAVDAQFCAGCGHGLYEKCGECGASVALTQKFCVSCGTNLAEHLLTRTANAESRLKEAIASAKQHQYDRALRTLEELAANVDFRFADVQQRASMAVEKVQVLQSETMRDVQQRVADALDAANQSDHRRVVELLGDLPGELLDDESTTRLTMAQGQLHTIDALQRDLETYLQAKEYETCAGLVDQLLEMRPESQSLQALAGKLAAKFFRRAEKQHRRGDYDGAGQALQLIPQSQRDRDYQAWLDRNQLKRWLSNQTAGEPFATATLGRLAVRFAKDCDEDDRAKELVQKLSAAVKTPRPTKRDRFASWQTQPTSWLGGDLGVFAHPQSIDTSVVDDGPTSYTDFAVAIGLALHGLGLGRFSGNLIQKQGLMSKLAFGKAKSVWGIDVGSSAIHAIRISHSKAASKPIVETALTIELAVPTCRGGGESARALPNALAKLMETIDVTGSQVWANLPDCDSIARFSELPPVKDKEVDRLITAEAKSRIPIPADELAMMTWLAPLDEASGMGRPLTMAAATKRLVDRRVDQLSSMQLKVDGLIPEAVAVANFTAFEFAEELQLGGESSDASGADGERDARQKLPTVAMIDAGASKTLIVLVSPIAVWYWRFESGGEDITRLVSKTNQQTAEQAEATKQNLEKLPSPHLTDELIGEKLNSVRSRLVQFTDEAKKTFAHMDVRHTWCVGAAQLQHGFHRRVLLASKNHSP